jgi:hypothetical protein
VAAAAAAAGATALAAQEHVLLVQIASLPEAVVATLPPAQRQQYDDAVRLLGGVANNV